VHTVSLDGAAITWDLAGSKRFGRPFRAGAGHEPSSPELAPGRFAVSPDGKLVATPQADGRTAVVALASGKRVTRTAPSPGGRVAAVAWHPTGAYFVTTGGHGHVEAWRRDGSHLRSYRGAEAASEAAAEAVSPDGKLLAASSGDGRVYVWEAGNGRLVTRELVGQGTVFALAFSPDGTLLAGASASEGPNGGLGRVWRLSDRKLLYTVNIDDGYGFGDAIAFTPDGKLLATGGGTGVVKFWDARTGKPDGRNVPAVAGWVESIDFDPSGRLMVTAGTDGTTRLFDVQARAQLGTPLPGLDNLGANAEFTPDGNGVVTVYEREGSGFVHDLRRTAWETRACSVAGRTLTRDEWQLYLPDRDYRPACSA
jgi:WD40 repeat protein